MGVAVRYGTEGTAVAQTPAEARAMGAAPYEAIFEYSLDAVLFTIPDGHILAANPAACQLLARSEDEIRAVGRQGLADLTDARWVAGLEERERTGRTRMQARMIRGDGTTFEADISSAIFTNAEGERRTVVIFRDLSERLIAAQELALADDRDRIARNLHGTVMRRLSNASMLAHSLHTAVTDDAARARVVELVDELDQTVVDVRLAVFRLGSEHERRYQTLVENSPLSVAVYRGSDTRFVYANQSAVELYGAHDLEDMLSRYAYELIPEDLKPGWQKRVQRILDGAVIRQGRYRLATFDGHEITVEANATRVVLDGELCVQVELRDISRWIGEQGTVRLDEAKPTLTGGPASR
jgi:PAS domain S-box-containing protein